MRAVLADDLSGAAELAGLGLEHGYTAQLQTALQPDCTADLLVVDSNTRRLPAAEAARVVGPLTRSLLETGRRLFKKVDSVLRGPVAAELRAMLATGPWQRVLLVPANPSHGRTIIGGRYLIDGVPLDQTDFAHDPEYPARSCQVLDLLGPTTAATRWVPMGTLLPGEGIAIVDAEQLADVADWARQLDERTLPAGAADFFQALLACDIAESDRHRAVGAGCPEAAVGTGATTTLFVCGSAAAWPARRQQAARYDIPILWFPGGPPARIPPRGLADQWIEQAATALGQRQAAIVTAAAPSAAASAPPQQRVTQLARLVAELLHHVQVDRLCVEGGTTASALVRHMGWSRLAVRRQYQPGVVLLQPKPDGPELVVKPGSYAWPAELWP